MRTPLAVALIAVLLVACSGAAGPTPTTPSSSPSPGGSAPPAPTTITTPEEAAARVIEVNPSLAGIGPKDPDIIGGCCFWEATPTENGFSVVFEVGWGDCPAGCIERHRWTYAVDSQGGVELESETGSPIPPGVPGAGGGSGGGGILPGGSGIQGTVLAGPTCPVVSVNDPNCADRPVAGATIVVLDASGQEVGRTATDAAGHYAIALPAGPYMVEPQPVEGYMGTAGPLGATVGGGFVTVDLGYDTGIR